VTDPTSTAFESITRAPSLSDKVAELLTEAIVSRKIRPGEKLPSERDLGEKFKVSRTVVREAVRSLAARGLVRVTAGRGVEVNEIDGSGVADSMRLLVRGHEGLDYAKVHEVRAALEVQTAGLAAERATPENLVRLKKLCDDYEKSLEKRDFTTASELDFQFHRELMRATDNELLLAMLDSIADVLREVRTQSIGRPHVGEQGLKAHLRILKSVKAGNVEAARQAMSDHLTEAASVWRGETAMAGKNTRHRIRSRS
jgi:GntR family transcriptional repressor for pyruvate dehydrogenase complex